MITLLALIGILWLFYKVSKGLTKLGTFLEKAGEYFADRSASNTRTNQNSEQARTNITKVRDTLNKIKREEDPDEEYITQVRDEIDHLTERE